uniref:STAS domain-containing protein n=1 Tax=Chromera velia CCMP2878 TaxID=1169474 RepID=A0A0G4HFE4_9ALVE|eukprot:Cvel_27012.t1-p1 / transcript=Cvel_27012.t1 / gene=Cvel_27012 / organism=Chromera_velia_CCMP2878 / gene_product=Putative sulfate transporter YbaR, putative / transcript_product=Putative sulfate transporter YbaR, putative / location=Cvel_scaffold3303:5307-14971(+) / protein_length=990 / sequence_SO=supercontig / SO=protein_coding / is_pseudo=false
MSLRPSDLPATDADRQSPGRVSSPEGAQQRAQRDWAASVDHLPAFQRDTRQNRRAQFLDPKANGGLPPRGSSDISDNHILPMLPLPSQHAQRPGPPGVPPQRAPFQKQVSASSSTANKGGGMGVAPMASGISMVSFNEHEDGFMDVDRKGTEANFFSKEASSVSTSSHWWKGLMERHAGDKSRPSISMTSSSSRQKKKIQKTEPFYTAALGYKDGWLRSRPYPRYMMTEILSGLIIGFAQIPESIAFALLANVDPAIGLHGAWIECTIETIFGGKAAVTSSVTGSAASIIKGFVKRGPCPENPDEVCVEGLETMWMVTLIVGFIHIVFSFLKLSKLAELISMPVMIGFSNGLGLIILISQFHFFEDPQTHKYVTGLEAGLMAVECILAVVITEFFPKIPRVGKLVPSALLALGATVLFENLVVRGALGTLTPDLNDVAPFSEATAFPALPFFSDKYDFSKVFSGSSSAEVWSKMLDLFVKSILIFIVTVCESLMTVEIMSDLMREEGNGDQQVFGMGLGNAVSGFLGGMPADASIALSVMNLQSGGRGKEAPLTSAIVTFILVAFGYPVLNFIPTAGLAGVMFVVFYHTFKWFSLPVILASFLPSRVRRRFPFLSQKIKRWDAAIIVVVTVLTVVFDLAVAVMVGVFLSCVVYTWESRKRLHANTGTLGDTKYYELSGPVFFASKKKVERFFDVQNDPQNVVLVFKGSGLYDYASLEILNTLKRRYRESGRSLRIKGLKENCKKMLDKAGHLLKHMDMSLVEVEIPRVRNMLLPSGVEVEMQAVPDADREPEEKSPSMGAAAERLEEGGGGGIGGVESSERGKSPPTRDPSMPPEPFSKSDPNGRERKQEEEAGGETEVVWKPPKVVKMGGGGEECQDQSETGGAVGRGGDPGGVPLVSLRPVSEGEVEVAESEEEDDGESVGREFEGMDEDWVRRLEEEQQQEQVDQREGERASTTLRGQQTAEMKRPPALDERQGGGGPRTPGGSYFG